MLSRSVAKIGQTPEAPHGANSMRNARGWGNHEAMGGLSSVGWYGTAGARRVGVLFNPQEANSGYDRVGEWAIELAMPPQLQSADWVVAGLRFVDGVPQPGIPGVAGHCCERGEQQSDRGCRVVLALQCERLSMALTCEEARGSAHPSEVFRSDNDGKFDIGNWVYGGGGPGCSSCKRGVLCVSKPGFQTQRFRFDDCDDAAVSSGEDKLVVLLDAERLVHSGSGVELRQEQGAGPRLRRSDFGVRDNPGLGLGLRASGAGPGALWRRCGQVTPDKVADETFVDVAAAFPAGWSAELEYSRSDGGPT